jgi:hypothetical protein
MAITIESQPQDFTTMGNPITFVLSSTNVAQPNFKFVADVFVGATQLIRLKTSPNPSNNQGYFDIREVMRTQIEINTDIEEGQGFECADMWKEYTVEFSEEYSGASATTYDFTGTVYCGAIDTLDFPSYDFTDYVVSSTPAIHQLLTNRPQSSLAIAQENGHLQSGYLYVPCTIENTANIDYVRYRYFSSGGNLLREYFFQTKNYAYHNGGDPNENSVITVPFMPLEVYSIPSSVTSDSVDGATDFPFDDGYYSLTLSRNPDDSQLQSAEYFVHLNVGCQRFNVTELHFQNQLGGIDSYVFTKPNRETQTTERTQASKPLLTMGDAYTYTLSSYSRFNANVDFVKEFTVTSDWLNDSEFEWLAEMIRTPRAWVRGSYMGESGVVNVLIPILITNTAYNVFKREFDQLHTLSITYRYTFDEAKPL